MEKPQRISARGELLGSAAQRAVSAIGEGHVLAVFERSFYLAGGSGALACVGPPGLGAGPLNLLCELPSPLDWSETNLCRGTIVRREGERLRVGELLMIDLSAAAPWRPPMLALGWRRGDLAAGIAALAELAAAARPEDGFGPWVSALALRRVPRTDESGDVLLLLAEPGLAALAGFLDRALVGEEVAAPASAAEILLGLGPGLTPSGDDLIGGVLVALSALGRRDVAARLAAWALPLATVRTGAISLAHLRCAAAGEGAAALHDVLASLTMPGAPRLADAVSALTRLGHSSGWDMLAGIALAAAAYLRAG